MTISINLPKCRIDEANAGGYWPNRLITDYLDEAVARHPEKAAIIGHAEPTGEAFTMTHARLKAAADRMALALVALGVEANDVVACQLPNRWEMVALYLGVARIGAVINPLVSIYRRRELEFMLNQSEAKVLVTPGMYRNFDYQTMARDLAREVPTLRHVFALGGEGEDDFNAHFLDRDWESEIDAAALFDQRRPHPDAVTELLYTSGTTGEPKGVLHTSNTLLSLLKLHIERIGVDGDEIILQSAPMAHQAGFLHGLIMPIMVGATAVLQDIWDPDEAVRLIERYRVTYSMGATTFLADLADSPEVASADLDSFRVYVTAGAPIPSSVVRRATERLNAQVISGWGMSEFGTGSCTLPDDPLEKIFNTDGVPFPGIHMRVADENGEKVSTNSEGRLLVRGVSQFVGYLNRPDLDVSDSEGWFDTGDLACMDGDGYIRITGRSKDIIIRGGTNIPVVEIEEQLHRHPAVKDVAVVAMPDPRLGEKACAFVVTRPGSSLDFDEMIAFLLAADMSKTYLPERLELIGDMPRTASGKIQKYKLREQTEEFAN
ncbi:MAG: AMP-binding protein [Rhodospirillales bacterium]|jgi:cyclohexanecarboxylate-CoA ligase|nr:cyclohexanecarboxylate-CoA ligase [Rhodospirillaceae bacterium]MDP6429100.1 AMP-binding protein [Rhodospirillales bacterium]MDP6645777.1 AMP-binding protein [Rhodospirillales bacterium]MDP6843489.1 AMP-binding protein [Rhodospirillales bacterium]